MERELLDISSERTTFIANHAAISDELKRILTKTQEIEAILRGEVTPLQQDIHTSEPPKKRMKYEDAPVVIYI